MREKHAEKRAEQFLCLSFCTLSSKRVFQRHAISQVSALLMESLATGRSSCCSCIFISSAFLRNWIRKFSGVCKTLNIS